MPPIIEQQITFLYTRDLVAAVSFYEQALGLSLARDQGSCRIYHVAGAGYIGLCQREHIPADKSGVIFTLVTPDVDGWYQYLLAQGVMFEKPPSVNPRYNIYHCFVRDPDGYLIEIQRFLD